jgi:hypothetical protein
VPGAVTLIYANAAGLTGAGATAFSQNSAGIPGIPGTAEDGDWFGGFFSW